ncbi:single-stranded-DNA-specific exonuclease RecJ [bacterium TMED277]|nr:single-stranded-DNA-specific exonuclease RecJ [Candidatus Pelagibacter sp.]OUX41565.1 MAG: single-stranded-DNA-specific exonuclease RecJ [bacterium TMED277]
MISITGKQWQQRKVNKNIVEKLKQDFDFSDILSRLIVSRGFDENEILSIKHKLDLPNVFKNNRDFLSGIELLTNTINNKEKICIVGDYDVDGSCATSLFTRYLQSINHPFTYYIPDRQKDGYGASKKIFEKLIENNPNLIIMLDCGSTSVEAINFLNKNKIKSLIIDHHEINTPYPNSNVIINPKKNNGYIEFDYLCATTLTYFFLDLLSKKIHSKINIRDYLIYVLLATVCDVMPLRKLNRLISINALKDFNISENSAINEIYNLNNKKNKININDLGYFIGPIINAGGRLGKSNYATELLSSDNIKIINNKSIELIKLNEKRKKIETTILNEIDFTKIENENKNIIIYYDPNINEGLIGIIASRIKDYFNKPSIVITKSNDVLKGSARSVYDYNIGRVIKNALDAKIISIGGGHSMAAGFSLQEDKLLDFKNFLCKDFKNQKTLFSNIFNYDYEISSIAFNKEFFNEIKKMEPFGEGNPLPTFFFKDLKVVKTKILQKKHISLLLKSKIGYSINSISFNSFNNKIGEYLLNYKKNLNVLGQIKENFWNNKNSLQLTIRDIII